MPCLRLILRWTRLYGHILRKYAKPINTFYQVVFNPCLNLHRPCMFASEAISPKGKVIKRDRHEEVKTPLEALKQLCDKGLARLKGDVTLVTLQEMASAKTDLAAPQEMQRTKAELFQLFNEPRARTTKAA